MCTAISQKCTFGQKFRLETHRMIILVPSIYVVRVKESNGALIF